jgi:hypothetical protein
VSGRSATIVALVAATLLGGCATMHGGKPAGGGGEEAVTLAVGPCFGFCPVYHVRLGPDGTMRFVGERHTAVLGERVGSIGRKSFLAVSRDLATFRPATGTEADVTCDVAISDTSSYTVTWSDPGGRTTVARVESGCPAGRGRALAKLLRDMPRRLGFDGWAAQKTRQGESRG